MRSARFSVILVLVACALGIAPAAAIAANEIAYRCDLDVCLLDPANPGAVTNLTDNGSASYDEKPIWSPDGNKVAFVSDFTQSGHGEKNVFVMEPGAAGQAVNLATQITPYSSGGKGIGDLAWSPDGSRIAYTRGNNAADDGVWVVNADGTSTFPLGIGAAGDNQHPTWSADSAKIAYSSAEQVYVAPSTGGVGLPLGNGAGHDPAWSPDGVSIAFDQINAHKAPWVDLHVVNADGSGAPVVVPGEYTQWSFAAWAPDSGRLAYRYVPGGEEARIHVVSRNGGGDHPLASAVTENVYEPSWSPDGSRVVYEAYRWLPSTNNNIYVANADGSGAEVPLTSDGKSYEPAWRVVLSTPQAPPQAPGATPGAAKPKVVWITKRIPWTPGRPIFVAATAAVARVAASAPKAR